MRRKVLFMMLLLASSLMKAETVEIDGINYEIVSGGKAAVVTKGNYSGSIIIPESITYNGKKMDIVSIGREAFANCVELQSITIPNTVTSISYYAFGGCTKLTSINVPLSVNSIDENAFEDCRSLTSFVIPEGLQIINSFTFANCTSLNSVTIPNSVTEIHAGAFQGCESLSSITLPDNLIVLQKWAFQKCLNLISVKIPNNIYEIAPLLFWGCSNLKSVEFNERTETIQEGAFQGCTSLENIRIPSFVSTIVMNAFRGCTSLKTIVFESPYGFKLGEKAIAECPNLEKIYCYSETVPNAHKDAFADSYIQFVNLYVPQAVIGEYKSTSPWKEFKDILDIETASIKKILIEQQENEIYGIDGNKRNNLKNGLNILRNRNGKTKKVLVTQ